MSPGEVDQNSCDACLSITEILNKCPEYTVFGVCYPSKLCDALVRYQSETTQELKFAKLPFDDMSMNVLATDASLCLPSQLAIRTYPKQQKEYMIQTLEKQTSHCQNGKAYYKANRF